MERVWTRSYPPGASAEIDPDAFPNIPAMVDAAVKKFGDAPAVTCFGSSLSFRQLDKLADDFASFLVNHCKLKPGVRVAIMSPNLQQFPVALVGLLRAGLIAVNVNPLYTTPEVAFQLSDAGVEAILVCDSTSAALAAALPKTVVKHVIVTGVGDLLPAPKRWIFNLVAKRKAGKMHAAIPGAIPFRKALAIGRRRSFTSPELSGEDLAFLQYTGGTTGRSKGAMLTHRNLVANILQSIPFMQCGVEPPTKAGDVAVTPLPLYHVYALGAFFGFLSLGMNNVLIANPRDLDDLIKTIAPLKMRLFIGINTLFNAMMHHPKFDTIDFSQLRFTIAGGAATETAVAKRWEEMTGNPILSGYGLSETSPVLSVTPALMKPAFTGASGLPVPSLDLKFLDDEGHEVASGEVGEICVRGPNIMHGYWNQPEETALALDADGWFKTGDIGKLDPDGRLRIVDRKKDMILVSGFNVYPNEVEDVLAHNPGVAEAAVIGQPSEHSGESVLAVVVRKDPNLTEAMLIAYARERLAAYKTPKAVKFVDSLPKSNIGKVLRRQLRDTILKDRAPAK
ncbi:AMP-binding protein [Caulobacter sp. S45]|uniref:AMP-binding protein n=1 Tax=Caulobacter sp. S45 TaxID=1641861 RepID=UPI00131C0F54|nr:AMP-binding protein [Caulobacter sp. S45]